MKTGLLILLFSITVGVFGGSHLAFAQANCWCKGCNCTDGIPDGCLAGCDGRYVQQRPDPNSDCALNYGSCLHVRRTECHTTAPSGASPTILMYADGYQCTTQQACQNYA